MDSVEINTKTKNKIYLKEKLDLIAKNKLYEYFRVDNNYQKFFNNIIKELKGIEYLAYIKKIIPEKEYDINIVEKIYDWVCENIKTYKSLENIDIIEDLSFVLSILISFKSKNIGHFLKLLQKTFKDKYVVKIYIYFLDKNKLKNNYKEQIVNFILSQIKNIFKSNDLTLIIYILSTLKNNKDIKTFIINKLKNHVITEDEFYSENISNNIKLLNDLIEINFFEGIDGKSMDEYTIKTLKIISLIKSKFENKTFIFEKSLIIYKNFFNDKDPTFKIRLLFLNENNKIDRETKTDQLFKQFIEDVYKIQNEIFNLEEIESYIEYFLIDSKDKEILLLKLKKFILLLKSSELRDFNEIKGKEDYIEIIKYLDKSKFYNNLKKSKCFINIFNECKQNMTEENEETLLKKVIEKFNNLKNIFLNNNLENIESFENDLKFLAELGMNSQNSFNEEINFLKNYFKIKIDDETMD